MTGQHSVQPTSMPLVREDSLASASHLAQHEPNQAACHWSTIAPAATQSATDTMRYNLMHRSSPSQDRTSSVPAPWPNSAYCWTSCLPAIEESLSDTPRQSSLDSWYWNRPALQVRVRDPPAPRVSLIMIHSQRMPTAASGSFPTPTADRTPSTSTPVPPFADTYLASPNPHTPTQSTTSHAAEASLDTSTTVYQVLDSVHKAHEAPRREPDERGDCSKCYVPRKLRTICYVGLKLGSLSNCGLRVFRLAM